MTLTTSIYHYIYKKYSETSQRGGKLIIKHLPTLKFCVFLSLNIGSWDIYFSYQTKLVHLSHFGYLWLI